MFESSISKFHTEWKIESIHYPYSGWTLDEQSGHQSNILQSNILQQIGAQHQCAWTFELTPGSPLKVAVNPIFFNMHPSVRLGRKSEILHVLISSIESSKDTWNQTQLDCFGRQSTTRTHHPIQLNQILGNQTFMNLLFPLQYTWFSDHFQDCYHIIPI